MCPWEKARSRSSCSSLWAQLSSPHPRIGFVTREIVGCFNSFKSNHYSRYSEGSHIWLLFSELLGVRSMPYLSHVYIISSCSVVLVKYIFIEGRKGEKKEGRKEGIIMRWWLNHLLQGLLEINRSLWPITFILNLVLPLGLRMLNSKNSTRIVIPAFGWKWMWVVQGAA